ncbi:kinetochore protein Spc25 [Amia ocellicauda]|uniref:kinetochore protein Spc25 n=1 Tax=Amia ocellicauda TaxID=2972642 RepID=UPI0034648124
MACITQADVSDHFSKKLEDVRSKLFIQALGDLYATEVELKQAHKDAIKSIKDTCSKKCKDDEIMFEKIQAYKDEMQQKSLPAKEREAEIAETLSEIQDKEKQKEAMIRNIQKLTEEQARKKQLMIAQNKANKDKLKNLNKAKQVFQERLGLEIRKLHGEKLQFVFRNISHKDPDSVYTFLLRIDEEGSYEVISCDPPLECMSHLEHRLKQTNNFSAFLANVRKEFSALTKS